MNAGHTPRLLGERGSDNVVAVLYLEGEIVDGWGELTNIGGDRFAAELRQLRKDDDVKAVVLRVNSPGGSAYASEVIQREIIALKAKKPVIVSMGNYAASGGYWVSTYGDHIFAEPNTLTGSIGVFGMFIDIQKLGNNFGVTWDMAKTGQYADFETESRAQDRRRNWPSPRPAWTISTASSSTKSPTAATSPAAPKRIRKASMPSPRAASGPAPRRSTCTSSTKSAASRTPSPTPPNKPSSGDRDYQREGIPGGSHLRRHARPALQQPGRAAHQGQGRPAHRRNS